MQGSGEIRLTLHDPRATAPQVTVSSKAQPQGVVVTLKPTGVPGNFAGKVNVQKTGSNSRNTVHVSDIDVLTVSYQDAPGHIVWSTADVLLKKDKDQPPTVHHDQIYIATDAKDLPVMTVATDDLQVEVVKLYYRVAGSASFIQLPMPQTYHDAYTAVIPASAVTPLGLEYYITAKDSKGNVTSRGSAASPLFVAIQPRTLTAP
jgi:hypothetical protein